MSAGLLMALLAVSIGVVSHTRQAARWEQRNHELMHRADSLEDVRHQLLLNEMALQAEVDSVTIRLTMAEQRLRKKDQQIKELTQAYENALVDIAELDADSAVRLLTIQLRYLEARYAGLQPGH